MSHPHEKIPLELINSNPIHKLLLSSSLAIVRLQHLYVNTFFKDYPPPVFIDEIQYAPALFPYIKIRIDQTKTKGQFYLSGSQKFQMMKNISESLAGRVGILNLLGLSVREIRDDPFDKPFIPGEGYYTARKESIREIDYPDIWRLIHRGSMPELAAIPDFDWQTYYAAYVSNLHPRNINK